MARLLFATGGSGGHIYPAVAVAAAAERAGHQVAVIGARDGMEARLVPEAGIRFLGVPAGKWRRGRPGLGEALRALQGLAAGLRHVRREAPDAVIGFGGFASFPGTIGAVLTRTPLVLVEGNVLPGRVIRWFARRAVAVALAVPETARHLPGARTVVTGWPVRPERLPRAEARRALGLPEARVLTLVLGGSQGSAALNELVPSVAATLPEPPLVLHQTGERWRDEVEAALPRDGRFEAYRTVGYLDATLAWSAADLAITRAGISTLSEAAHHGVPVVAVPLPSSADDHQRHNARAVAEAGAGAYVEQDDPEALRAAWLRLLDPAARAEAGRRARARAASDAADAVLAVALEAIGAPPSPTAPPDSGRSS